MARPKVSLADAGVYKLTSKYKKCISYDSVEVKVMRILGKEPQKQSEAVFPNPSDNILKVPINLTKSGQINYQIVDGMGKVIFVSKSIFKNQGKHEFTVNVENLASGSYMLQLDSQTFKSNFKFVKN
jgi:hypothetical protein